MLSKKLFLLLHKVALFAIVFASLAPSISHAMAAGSNGNSFSQEICASNGKKISIQVQTTKGQQLSIDFALEKTSQLTPKSQNIAMHLEHCPFCAGQFSAASLPASNAIMIAQLTAVAQKTAKYAAPVFASHTYVSPPSQAPPRFSIV